MWLFLHSFLGDLEVKSYYNLQLFLFPKNDLMHITENNPKKLYNLYLPEAN